MKREGDKLEEEFCKCENSSGVSSQPEDFGYWLVCTKCNKKIEDSYEYYNHYDGEDHGYDY